MRRFRLLSGTLVVVFCWLAYLPTVDISTAHADQPATQTIDYRLDHNKPAGDDPPQLTFDAPLALDGVEVLLERSGNVHQTESIGDMQSGESATIAIEQAPGRHHYDATIRGTGSDGTDYDFQFSFEVRVTDDLEVELQRDDVDLDAGLIPLRVNRPVDRIELQVADGDGRRIAHETRSLDEQRGRIDVEWDADGDVAQAQVTVYDVDENWTTYTLEPFWIEIPQQVINFETGTATIEDDQASKLAETRDRVVEALEQHDDRRSNMRLYVAGYTDTVGPADANLELSQQRARAIARWFRDHDVDIPIYYQGFGQDVLAVETPDETEEEQNRRAVYILGNTPPTTSDDIPRSNWQRLRQP